MKKLQDKKDLVINDFLARLTDYQLQSSDKEFFDWGEKLRELLCNAEEAIKNNEI